MVISLLVIIYFVNEFSCFCYCWAVESALLLCCYYRGGCCHFCLQVRLVSLEGFASAFSMFSPHFINDGVYCLLMDLVLMYFEDFQKIEVGL